MMAWTPLGTPDFLRPVVTMGIIIMIRRNPPAEIAKKSLFVVDMQIQRVLEGHHSADNHLIPVIFKISGLFFPFSLEEKAHRK